MPTDFVIVRHGDPAAGGVEDPQLSELGRRQAEATARHLAAEALAAVYVSPLRRATESARPLAEALGVEPVVEERVAEFDRQQVYYSEKHAADIDDETAISLIDQMRSPEFRARVLAGFDDMETAHPDATVAVVCHGGVLSIMVSAAVYNDSLMFLPDYGSVTRIRSHGAGLRNLVSYNERYWLPATG